MIFLQMGSSGTMPQKAKPSHGATNRFPHATVGTADLVPI